MKSWCGSSRRHGIAETTIKHPVKQIHGRRVRIMPPSSHFGAGLLQEYYSGGHMEHFLSGVFSPECNLSRRRQCSTSIRQSSVDVGRVRTKDLKENSLVAHSKLIDTSESNTRFRAGPLR